MSDALSAIDALAGRLADIERRLAGVKTDPDAPSGTATDGSGLAPTDESGLASATGDATGELTDLSLAATAPRAEDLAAVVPAAHRQARAAATGQPNEHAEGLAATLGAGLNGIFGTSGDPAPPGRVEGAVGRLDGRLPGPPA
ncbi:hypothetical protein ACSNOB_16475 [Micromonospora sp. URMC 106]|uniref:hypothetical protein n=1 Tax=Micromonospora sp. URMC 106 TaxID=3423408 RepID=UPI003F1D5181